MSALHRFHNSRGGTAFMVRVVPRSARNEIVEFMADGTVRIHLTAPPLEGKANQQLIKFLAGILQVHPSRIEIVGGEKSKNKMVSVEGLSPAEVEQRLFAHLRSD